MTSSRGHFVPSLAGLVLASLLGGCGKDDGGPPVDMNIPCAKASGNICTIAGTGTPGDGADRRSALLTNIYLPQDVAVAPAPDGRVFVVDWNNHRVRVVENDGTMTIVAGSGELGLMADTDVTTRLNHPTSLTFDADGKLVIAAWHNSRIKKVDLSDATFPITDVCGTGGRGFGGDGGPADVAVLNLPVAVVYDAQGNMVIADQANNRLRTVDATTHVIATVAGGAACATPPCDIGDGLAPTAARFSFPAGQAALPGGKIDIDAAGNIYIADTSNGRVRKIDATTQIVSTIAGTGTFGYSGDGGRGVDAQVGAVPDVAVAPDGSVYFADPDNDCVRVIRTDGMISAAAGVCRHRGFGGDGGPATAALLDRPAGVAVDVAGNLYIADTHNQRVRIVYK